MKKEEIVDISIKKHKFIYDYSLLCDDYNYRMNDKVAIMCIKHGLFKPRLTRFLNGSECPYCANKKTKNVEDFIDEANKKHSNFYSYEKFDYINAHTKSIVTCPIHGDFEITPTNHLNGCGCPKCKGEKLRKGFISNKDEFIRKSIEIHGDKYTYDRFEYKGNSVPSIITCKKHGDFLQIPHNHLQGKGCPMCGKIISKWENEIDEFIKSLGVETVRNRKDILGYNLEIDIFVPSFNIGFECDGLKWHSEEYKDKNYHLFKTETAIKNGIRLIHIFEDEWILKKDIVKSKIMNLLRMSKNTIYARNCTIEELSSKEKREFNSVNHLQGDANSNVNIGLKYNGMLVSVMTFGKKRLNLGNKTSKEGEYELIRFCNQLNTNVIGGASKLFNYFIKNYSANSIVSYCDRRWSYGLVYGILGFDFVHSSNPNYFYVVDGKRENRFKYRKDVLVSQGFDKNKSEHDIMLSRGIYRIYDCGTHLYKWKKH